MTFIDLFICSLFIQSNVKTLYIDVYMIVCITVELDILFDNSHFSNMFQYMYEITELKKIGFTHKCNRMVLGTLYYHWKQVLLLYLNTKQNTCLLVKICCLSFPSSFINVHTVTQVTQMSMLQFI